MKKILSIVLVALLAIGCFALVGCGGDATFGGNYEEATATDIQSFADAAALAGGSNEVDPDQGYQLVGDATMEGLDYDLDIRFKRDNQHGLVLQAKMNMNVGGQSMNMNAYVVNNYLYAEMMGQKIKMEDEMITPVYTNLLNMMESLDLSALIEGLETNTKLGIARDDDGTTKIKFEIPENYSTHGTIILVYSADYDLIAMKYDIAMGENFAMNISFKPWSGTINLPNLNSYVG